MCQVWTCDVCGSGGLWRDGHSQVYGSILTEEEGIPQLYTCSGACRLKVPDACAAWKVKVDAVELSKRQRKLFEKTIRRQ